MGRRDRELLYAQLVMISIQRPPVGPRNESCQPATRYIVYILFYSKLVVTKVFCKRFARKKVTITYVLFCHNDAAGMFNEK